MPDAAWKPWVAGALVLAAVLLVGRNVVEPYLHRDAPAPAATPEVVPASTEASVSAADPATAASTPAAPDTTSLEEDSAALSGWRVESDRDPFAPGASGSAGVRHLLRDGPPAPPMANSVGNPNATTTPRPTTHKVTALAWGNGRIALVDGVAVQVGDSFLDGRVRDIGSDRLVLARRAGDTVLRFWEGKKP